MPELPRILVRQQLPDVNLPRASEASYGAQVFSNAAHALSEVGNAMRDKQTPIDVAQSFSEYNIEAEDLKAKVMAENPDPNTWRDEYIKGEAGLRKQRETALQANPEAKLGFSLQAAKGFDNHIKDIMTKAAVASHDKARGDFIGVSSTLAQQAGQSDDPETRRMYTNTFMAMVNAASRPTVINGRTVPATITAVEAETARQKFNEDTDKNRAGYLLERAPQRLEDEMTAENFPFLTPTERNAMRTHGREAVHEQRIIKEKREKEQLDAVKKDLLIDMETSKLPLTTQRQRLLERTDLPFEAQKFFVDRMNDRIEGLQKEAKADVREARAESRERRAEAREAERDRKERDPFIHSDNATLARVTAGVLNEPDKWDQDKILSLMGKGLSVSHATQAVGMLERANKEPAGALTPIKMAQQTWGKLQSTFSFVSEDERKAPSTETLVKNNRQAQQIWDEVVRREADGQDPRKVLDELMVPFYEDKVKSFFSPSRLVGGTRLGNVLGVAPPVEKAESDKAKQELIKRGIAVTDENIAAVIKRSNELRAKK